MNIYDFDLDEFDFDIDALIERIEKEHGQDDYADS